MSEIVLCKCKVRGCSGRTALAAFMCDSCWSFVPGTTRRTLLATAGERTSVVGPTWARWWRARAAALHSAEVARGTPRVRADERLSRALDYALRLEREGAL